MWCAKCGDPTYIDDLCSQCVDLFGQPDECDEEEEENETMGGRSSRVKGHRFERELAITFRELYGESVKRGFQSRNGAESPDVDGLPFWVEAKRGKKTYPMAALAQAEEACADDGRPPVAVCRNDQDTDAVVVLRLSTFLDILKRPEVYCANQSQDSDR